MSLARPLRSALLASFVSCVWLGAGAPDVRAESELVLPSPTEWGEKSARTFDAKGSQVGAARITVSREVEGRVLLELYSGIESGGEMRARALLASRGDGTYRTLWQESQSADLSGRPLDLLRIDHEKGIGSCTPDGGRGTPRTLRLPARDRIANIPMALLFQPLARGEVAEMNFQIFLCGGDDGPRVIDMEAQVKRRAFAFHGPVGEVHEAHTDPANGNGTGLHPVAASGKAAERVGYAEIEYWPDISFVPRSLLPSYSFWLDVDGDYLGHEVPLYHDGPDITVTRERWSPRDLSASR